MIITIGREFSSGGRELGRKIAEELKIPYYDKEILVEISKKTKYSYGYIEHFGETKPMPLFPVKLGVSFSNEKTDANLALSLDIFEATKAILTDLAKKGDCVIIGRAADYILEEFKPLRIFVYASMEYKIKRCREKGQEDDVSNLTDRQLARKIRSIDRQRRDYYEFFSGKDWGDRLNYDLLINTTDLDIDSLAKQISGEIKRKK